MSEQVGINSWVGGSASLAGRVIQGESGLDFAEAHLQELADAAGGSLPAGVLKAGPVTKEAVAAAKAAAAAAKAASGSEGGEPVKKKTKRGGWHNRCQKLCDAVLFKDKLEETKRLAWQYYNKKKQKGAPAGDDSDTSSTS